MEQIKLANGLTIDFYTIAEKKPEAGDNVTFIVACPKRTYCSIINGRYATFKTAPGRFVSETHGSHKESTVLYWAKAYLKIN